MGRILRFGSLQLCQSLVNGLYWFAFQPYKVSSYTIHTIDDFLTHHVV